jgi:hypothetical protein
MQNPVSGVWLLPCERKHRHLVTRRNASIAPLTLTFAVVACRLVLSGCRVFAAYSPPGGSPVVSSVTVPRRACTRCWAGGVRRSGGRKLGASSDAQAKLAEYRQGRRHSHSRADPESADHPGAPRQMPPGAPREAHGPVAHHQPRLCAPGTAAGRYQASQVQIWLIQQPVPANASPTLASVP